MVLLAGGKRRAGRAVAASCSGSGASSWLCFVVQGEATAWAQGQMSWLEPITGCLSGHLHSDVGSVAAHEAVVTHVCRALGSMVWGRVGMGMRAVAATLCCECYLQFPCAYPQIHAVLLEWSRPVLL